MATVLVAILVFGLVGLAVWYIIRGMVRHDGSVSCSCGGGCSGCSSCSCGCDCASCSAPCGKGAEKTKR